MSASIYDPKTKTLVPFAGTSISMMSELSDVELSAPSDGQVLSYDATSQAWENADTVNEVAVTQVVSSGTKIATIAVDGTSTDLYAPEGGSGGGHTIEDSEGTELTQRDTLQFGEGFIAEDDGTNEKTVISPDVMQSGDMDDVITPLPSVAPKKEGIKYSTTEQVVGEWIDGKPLYAKTINTGALSNAPNKKVAHSISNLGEIVSMLATYHRTDGKWFQISNVHLTAAYKTLQLSITTTNVEIESNSGDYSDVDKSYVTLQYTKTTDTPNT